MKYDCPSCHKDINNMEIKGRRREGLVLKKQCPHCNTWLRLNPIMDALKTGGLIVLLVSSILNISKVMPAFEIELSIAGLIGVSLALFSALTGKLVIAEASKNP